MLKILRIPDRMSLQSMIRDFDPNKGTWVVSDLRSKLELQQRLLERDQGFLDSSVVRASDLWKTLLHRAAPGARVVSRDFARSVVRHFLHLHRDSLESEALSENHLLSLMDRFAGIVFHPQGDRLLSEWFEQNEEAAFRWKSRFQVAGAALKFMESQNLLTSKWVAAALQLVPGSGLKWDHPLIVDLGAELTSAEAALFHQLSRGSDVTLIEPMPGWRRDEEFLLRPYRDLEGFAARIETLPPSPVKEGSRTVKRFSSQLAEVKDAVAQARRWMEAGIPSDRVAILAPEIEEYWPVLKPYLDEEGLPADKATAVKLNALPVVNRWLSRLRPRGRDLTPADLELAYYSFEEGKVIRHELFRSLFVNLYGEEDLKRHGDVERFFRRNVAGANEAMSRDVFLEVAARFWENLDNTDSFLLLAREILANAPHGMELPFADWVRYAEAIAASKEIKLSQAQAGGLFIGNLSSAHASPATHRIFLGLSEEGLRKAERNPLPMKDIRGISKLGFHLDHPDQSLLEFELKWLCETPATEDVLMVGVSAFDGAVRAPSSLWLRYFQISHPTEAAEKLTLPRLTRWDQLQLQNAGVWERERRWSALKTASMMERIRLDLGEATPKPVLAPSPGRFSPSLVKTYLDCPFRLASRSLFRLQDLNDLDVDMARTDAGNLTHAVFQELTDNGWALRSEVTDQELMDLIEKARRELGFVLAEEKLWKPFAKRQLSVVKEFLRVERDWHQRFPRSRVLKSEQEWRIHFDPESGAFTPDPSESSVELIGRIDRLESDGHGRFVVVDYKASPSGLHHYGAWLDENELQLLFYMWALEKGAIPDLQGEVLGAFYYIYKNFKREIGFQIESEAGVLFPSAGLKKGLKAEREDKLNLFKNLEEKISSVVSRTRKGEWSPGPHEKNKDSLCERCAWSGLCRSSHLN